MIKRRDLAVAFMAVVITLGVMAVTAQTTVFGQFAVFASDQAHLYIPLITK